MGEGERTPGVYRRISSHTGEKGGVWVSTVYSQKMKRKITIGNFPSREAAEKARSDYIAAMAAHGVRYE